MTNQSKASQIYLSIRSRLDNPKFYHCQETEKEFTRLRKLWEELFPESNRDVIVPSGGIEVFHIFRDRKDLERVLKTGLKTYNQLVAEGVAESRSIAGAVGPYRGDIVYFTFPIDEVQRRLDNVEWVSVLVDPNRALVHNAHCRQYCPYEYWESVLILADYLNRLNQVVSLRDKKPTDRFILDPFSALPRNVSGGYESIFDVGYNYNEIGIPRIIPPSEFHRNSKDTKSKISIK